MSNPPETNLTQKFAALQNLISSNHTALMTEIAAIKTALTSSSGNIDAAPIVSAIQALAGPYPGRTLTDLYTVSSDIKSNIGLPTGDASTTLLGLLSTVKFALTTPDPATNATLLAKIDAIMRSLTLPASLDYTVLQELDLIRQGQATGLANLLAAVDPMAVEPPNLCSNAYSSTGLAAFSAGISIPLGDSGGSFDLSSETTFAVWGDEPPTGLSLAFDAVLLTDTRIKADNWLDWKIYVASNANLFGMLTTAVQRFRTNQWHIFNSGTDWVSGHSRFFVDGQNDIKVYFCRIMSEPQITTYTSELSEQNVYGSFNQIVWEYGLYEVPGLPQTLNNKKVILPGDYYGYQYRTNYVGVNISLYTEYGTVAFPVTSDFQAITVHTQYIQIYSGSTQFTIDEALP